MTNTPSPSDGGEKLLACPFCGGRPRTGGNTHTFLVYCAGCGAESIDFKTPGEAYAAWDRRAPSPLLEALEEAREALVKVRNLLADNRRVIHTWANCNGPCEPTAIETEASATLAKIDAALSAARGEKA